MHEQLWNVVRGPSECTWYGISWQCLTPYLILQKKIMVHYLLLQSQGQVPHHVTTEHMSGWLVAQGKKFLRERWVPRHHSPSLPFPVTSSTPRGVGKINNRKIRSEESLIALCFIWRVWKETLEEGNDLARLVRQWELDTYYKSVSSLLAFQQLVSTAESICCEISLIGLPVSYGRPGKSTLA